jgi:hypothetical protein
VVPGGISGTIYLYSIFKHHWSSFHKCPGCHLLNCDEMESYLTIHIHEKLKNSDIYIMPICLLDNGDVCTYLYKISPFRRVVMLHISKRKIYILQQRRFNPPANCSSLPPLIFIINPQISGGIKGQSSKIKIVLRNGKPLALQENQAYRLKYGPLTFYVEEIWKEGREKFVGKNKKETRRKGKIKRKKLKLNA